MFDLQRKEGNVELNTASGCHLQSWPTITPHWKTGLLSVPNLVTAPIPSIHPNLIYYHCVTAITHADDHSAMKVDQEGEVESSEIKQIKTEKDSQPPIILRG